MALTSLIRQIEVLDTSVTTGAGLTGKVYSDFTAKYCVDGGTLVSLTTETITTLGTYQAPTSSAHIRIKELNSADPTKGMYEVHFHNGQLTTGTRLWLYLSVAGGKCQRLEINLQDLAAETVVRGTVGSSASTTSIPTSACSPAGAAVDQFKGRTLIFTKDTATAALRCQATDITASSNASNPTLTVTALSTAPSSGDTFVIV